MPNLLITNGRIIDPASGMDAVGDVAISAGLIAAVGPGLSRSGADRVIDAKGCIVTPGLIDPHVHLREPGMEDAETIESGTRAAVEGGFTTLCCMPNTTPAIDDDAMVEFIYKQTERTGHCRVYPIGAATKGRRGEELAEIMLMARAGAVGFSDDGDCIASASVMAKALAYIRPTGLAFMQHCQEPTLTRGASMHAGRISTRLGLVGWPRVAEEMIIERDIRLLKSQSGAGGPPGRYHIQHMSSGGSVDLVRRARAEGLHVTAEVSPHHLLLTDEAICSEGAKPPGHTATELHPPSSHRRLGGGGVAPSLLYNTLAKMNPPLRETSDIEALRAGVADGTITVLATDHAPHTPERKALEFEAAPFGIVGLETALSLYINALVEPGVIAWPRLIEMLTLEPARLCNLSQLGRLAVGSPGDVTVIDPSHGWTIRAAELVGRSKNTPFDGWRAKGRAMVTVVGGVVKMSKISGAVV